jgi:hypothetical protein
MTTLLDLSSVIAEAGTEEGAVSRVEQVVWCGGGGGGIRWIGGAGPPLTVFPLASLPSLRPRFP